MAPLGAHLALSWRLLAASWRSWGLLGASWAALGAICSSNIKPGYHGTGSAFSERAASIASGQQQSRKASRKRSRQALRSRQASRARSAPPLSVLEGCRLERLSRGRAQRIASSIATCNENGLIMLPRGLPNRSKIAPRWLPGAPPESANGSGDLSCSFFWPLGRLSGRSWVALGRSWRSLGASWAVPGPPGALLGAIFVTQGPPLRPVWVSFSEAF